MIDPEKLAQREWTQCAEAAADYRAEADALRTRVESAERILDATCKQLADASAAIGTIRQMVGCATRNIGDVDMATHTREIGDAMRHRFDRIRELEAQQAGEGLLIVEHYEERLAAVEAERDAEIARVVRITERLGEAELRANRAERILAALREPSAEVVEETAKALYLRGSLSQWCTWEHEMERYKATYYEDALPIIRAAVAAAEQETSTETPRD